MTVEIFFTGLHQPSDAGKVPAGFNQHSPVALSKRDAGPA
jgi:hypothetical protein